MNISKNQFIKILPIISSVFLFDGCMPRQADGSYPTTYSYHPYNKLYKQQKPMHTNKQNYKTYPKRYLTSYNPSQYRRTYQPVNHNYSSIKKIEKIAISQMGKTYKWGANGPATFDCSGFTKYVFAKNGINLPRVSREQAKVGKYIPYHQLKKGDLLFFDSKKSSIVSHTGIYLGDSEFIHASSTNKRVVISSIHSGYYKKHFKWGRRLVD